jgi:hypothetical protein
MRGRELANLGKHRQRRRDDAQRQVLMERMAIHLAQRRVADKQRLDLGSES